jgi:hypothetical protein
VTTDSHIVPGSFRDPSGFLFKRDGTLLRQVNSVYRDNYDHLMNSGLYTALAEKAYIISHEEVGQEKALTDDAYKIIKPEPITFISYPYEWCFSQLKRVALLTLAIQKLALDHAMSLKDASAYNIQFKNGKPTLIDTISFEKYVDGRPWVAYRQFCQHFLAPLALMSRKDVRLSQLLRIHLDGIPLDLTASLLPLRSRANFALLSHIHLHARAQKHFGGKVSPPKPRKMPRRSLLALIDNLQSTVRKLKWRPTGTEWAAYYEDVNYSQDAIEEKKRIVGQFLDRLRPEMVWDLGANTGLFSRLAAERGAMTIAFDLDPAAVEINYLDVVKNNETNVLPLLIDLTNPSGGLGWENEERDSLIARGPADTAMALALIHHMAIANNLPLDRIAGFFSKVCKSLIIEFVPKSDSQVGRMLSTREDIFADYTQEKFETAFRGYFRIQESVKITGTERTIYLMQRE